MDRLSKEDRFFLVFLAAFGGLMARTVAPKDAADHAMESAELVRARFPELFPDPGQAERWTL